jgi:hypothetical protein
MSTSREAFEAWAIGETYAIREGDTLMWNYPCGFMAEEAWQAAMQYAYADASYLCDQMFNRAADADECADAIRERAKEVGK